MSDPLSSVVGVDLSSAVSVAVARKTLDTAKFEGAAAVSLIRAAGSVGANQQQARPMPGEPGSMVDVTG